jgi:hypothetical protein
MVSYWFSNCSDEKEKVEVAPKSKFDQLYTDLFSQCDSCHGKGYPGTENGPDLSSKDLIIDNLVGKTAKNYENWEALAVRDESCQDIPFINSGNASESMVVAILDATVAEGISPCVIASHIQGTAQNIRFTDATLALLKEWINEGALR